MQDETYCFIDDIRQKKNTATGAYHKVVKNGCKMPFEYKTRKELKQLMDSPVISTNPMPLKEFKKLSHEEQQRQLDMWGERYGKSSRIFVLLVGTPSSSANYFLRTNKLDFKSETTGASREGILHIKQLQTLCDAFYGRAGEVVPVEEPESTPPEEVTEVVTNSVLPEEESAPSAPLANRSRFDFSIEGVFTSDEMEVLLRSLCSASQINPNGSYKLTLTMTEA